jgi:hypothetical protein
MVRALPAVATQGLNLPVHVGLYRVCIYETCQYMSAYTVVALPIPLSKFRFFCLTHFLVVLAGVRACSSDLFIMLCTVFRMYERVSGGSSILLWPRGVLVRLERCMIPTFLLLCVAPTAQPTCSPAIFLRFVIILALFR